jgi:hypothetical protein
MFLLLLVPVPFPSCLLLWRGDLKDIVNLLGEVVLVQTQICLKLVENVHQIY